MRDYRDLLEGSRRARTVVLGVLLFWMMLGPAVGQLIHPGTKWFRGWTMYTGVGRGLRDVRFLVGRNGKLESIDWPSLPEKKQIGGRRGPWRRSIFTDADFHWAVDRMCEQLGPGADLRAIVRVGFNEGWKPLLDGKRNLCEGASDDQ